MAAASTALLLWIALAVAGVATVTDVRSGRIPNGLTVSAAVFGLGLRLALGGWAGLGEGVAGALGLGVPLVVAYAFLPLSPKGGDVKLLIALAAVLGWPRCWHLLVLTLLWGGVVSLVGLALAGRLTATLARVGRIVVALLWPGMRPEPAVSAQDGGTPVPYAIAVSLAVLTLVLSAHG